MKIVNRPNIFESNSSMAHSLIILPKADAEKWENDENMCYYDGKVMALEEAIKKIREKCPYLRDREIDEDDLSYYDAVRFDDWSYNSGWVSWERDTTEYKTENGDEIKIYAKYGYGG